MKYPFGKLHRSAKPSPAKKACPTDRVANTTVKARVIVRSPEPRVSQSRWLAPSGTRGLLRFSDQPKADTRFGFAEPGERGGIVAENRVPETKKAEDRAPTLSCRRLS